MSTPTRETLAARLRTLRDDIECAGRISPSLDGLLRQAADALAAMAWQDISTAPKDGTRVLISNDETMEFARWLDAQADEPDDMGYDAGWCGETYARPGRTFGNPKRQYEAQGQPTHWMPLPDPPPARTGADTGTEE